MRFTLSNHAKAIGICALASSLVTIHAFTTVATESSTVLSSSTTFSPSNGQEHAPNPASNHNLPLTALNMVNEFFPDESSSSSSSRRNNSNNKKNGGNNNKKRSTKSRFAVGEELDNLRADLDTLRDNLRWAEAMEDLHRIEDLQKAIANGENRDPDIMYKKAHNEMNQLKTMKLITQVEREKKLDEWTKILDETRHYLPQFQLDGLWEGNYGAHGYQLINVTYDGDTLLAYKVTGDANVPRGEITFKADLSPPRVDENGKTNETPLSPLKVSGGPNNGEKAGGGRTDFIRFKGQGQVSRKDFKDHRYVDGQFILLKERFSFLWVPTKHHVFFNRPTPEDTMKHLRNIISKEDEIENMREHVTRCFDMDMTTCIAREHDPRIKIEPFRRIQTMEELKEAEKLFQKSLPQNNLWQLLSFKKYIDKVLDGDKPLQ